MKRDDVIKLVEAEKREGFVTRYLSDAYGVHVLSDQGWQTLWTPEDDIPPRPGGADDSMPM